MNHVMSRRSALGSIATSSFSLTGLSSAVLSAAHAQSSGAYPTRPIRVVIPVPPGSAFDTVIRPLSLRVQPSLGQPFLIDNKPGASLMLGTSFVAHSQPDGYNLLLANDTPFSILPALNTPMQYDPDKDFTPLGLIAQASFLLITPVNFPANTLPEFIKYVKANPSKLSYATGGIGGQHHIAMENLLTRYGLDMLHVPYQGIGPAFNGLLSGSTQVMFAAIALPAQHILSGRLKALGWTSSKRHPSLPNVPTFEEVGVADFNVGAWFGLFAPAATPSEITKKISSHVWNVVSSKEYTDNVLLPAGFDANPSVAPDQFNTFLREDRRKWREWVARIDPKKLLT